MPFIGRTAEIELLREANWRDRGKLVALYGRRRVGKTALVDEAFSQDVVWKFEGIENAKSRLQISLFVEQLTLYTGDPLKTASNWNECFRHLEDALQKHCAANRGKRIVVFFDEFQWMCSMRPTLVSEFKFFWDNDFQNHREAVFVICGSISSFIVKKVVQSKALYGRVDLELHLKPLGARESRAFFHDDRPRNELLELQMLFGGIPQYLVELHPKRSLAQNLNELAFKPSGYFFQEFDRLFLSHFASNPYYKRILMRLAAGPCSSIDLAKVAGGSTGGALTSLLEELELAGFIERSSPLGKARNSKLVRYRLLDEYLHFYFALIQPNAPKILSGAVKYPNITETREYTQWLGYAFERFCGRNAAVIADRLKFAGINYEAGAWFRRADHASHAGVQVDLAFLRADKMISVCELKYVQQLLPKKWAAEMEVKKEALRAAFPGYGTESVLIVGKGSTDPAESWFDHVIEGESLLD